MQFTSREGGRATWTFQSARVNKPLTAVSKLLDDGYRAIFDSDGSYILHKASKQWMRVTRERGVFKIDAYLDQDPEAETAMDFHRQGAAA